MNWYLLVLKRYFVFQGRAGRPEFWWFMLINPLVSTVLSIFDNLLGWVVFVVPTGGGFDYHAPLFGTLYSLGVLIPSIAVTVRRLHDTDRSAWWLLLWLVPILGGIVFLIFMLLSSQAEANRYGPVPVRDPAA